MQTSPATQQKSLHPLHAAAAAAYEARDLSAWTDLYDGGALLVSLPDGAHLHGSAAIRPVLARFLALEGRLTAETIYALESGDLALLRGRFTLEYADEGGPQTMVAQTVEVARRGADGRWRFVLDHPAGAA